MLVEALKKTRSQDREGEITLGRGSEYMDDQELRDLISKTQTDGRISCKASLELAKTAGVPPARVGKLLNDMGIKIFGCQLGCFK